MLDKVSKENTTSEAKYINTIQGRKDMLLKKERDKTRMWRTRRNMKYNKEQKEYKKKKEQRFKVEKGE